MKKHIMLFLILSLFASASRAQFLGGFFSQKKENRKLLAQQIAALEVYKTYIKKGYDIISKGVTIIAKIKSGDFDLHRDFFEALKFVNPRVKKYPKVADMMAMNIRAVTKLVQLGKLGRSELVSGSENQYIGQVVRNMEQELVNTINALIIVVSDNQVALKDDERIERINRLYTETVDQYSFINSFGSDLSLFLQMKKKMKAEIKGSEFLNDVALPQP